MHLKAGKKRAPGKASGSKNPDDHVAKRSRVMQRGHGIVYLEKLRLQELQAAQSSGEVPFAPKAARDTDAALVPTPAPPAELAPLGPEASEQAGSFSRLANWTGQAAGASPGSPARAGQQLVALQRDLTSFGIRPMKVTPRASAVGLFFPPAVNPSSHDMGLAVMRKPSDPDQAAERQGSELRMQGLLMEPSSGRSTGPRSMLRASSMMASSQKSHSDFSTWRPQRDFEPSFKSPAMVGTESTQQTPDSLTRAGEILSRAGVKLAPEQPAAQMRGPQLPSYESNLPFTLRNPPFPERETAGSAERESALGTASLACASQSDPFVARHLAAASSSQTESSTRMASPFPSDFHGKQRLRLGSSDKSDSSAAMLSGRQLRDSLRIGSGEGALALAPTAAAAAAAAAAASSLAPALRAVPGAAKPDALSAWGQAAAGTCPETWGAVRSRPQAVNNGGEEAEAAALHQLADMRRSMEQFFGPLGLRQVYAMIVEQEATFASQLQALHHVYKVQRQIVEEAKAMLERAGTTFAEPPQLNFDHAQGNFSAAHGNFDPAQAGYHPGGSQVQIQGPAIPPNPSQRPFAARGSDWADLQRPGGASEPKGQSQEPWVQLGYMKGGANDVTEANEAVPAGTTSEKCPEISDRSNHSGSASLVTLHRPSSHLEPLKAPSEGKFAADSCQVADDVNGREKETTTTAGKPPRLSLALGL